MSTGLPPAFILAGGLGTRLAAAVPDRPKALAPIGDRPFLDIVFDQLLGLGIERVVLLLGARHEAILRFLADRKSRRQGRPDLYVQTSIEPAPLGTGGAVRFAHRFASEPFFLLNGDTYLDFDATTLVTFHQEKDAIVTLAASHQEDTARFGQVDVSPEGFVLRFREKAASSGPGLINGGVYLMDPSLLALIPDGRPVSLEQETFPRLLSQGKRMAAMPQRGDFFDIGTPESHKAFAAFIGQTPPTRNTPL
jgi:NDP-sugar pyrophosphorylase family protein